jgi:hypothetical protein
MIQLSEAVRKMEQKDENGDPIPFSLRFVAADKKKGKAGRFVDIDNAIIEGQKNAGNGKKVDSAPDENSKKPRHNINRTRNIIVLPSKKKRKLHLRLLTQFNGDKVVY